jgi:hypothetical protein
MNAAHTLENVEISPEYLSGHTPNAETIAAFEEVEAILRGEIPSAVFIDSRQYQTREELKTALKELL